MPGGCRSGNGIEQLRFEHLESFESLNIALANRDRTNDVQVATDIVTIPPIDLSIFGNPSAIPPCDYTVSGSLTVTGSDRFFLGIGDTTSADPAIFTPTAVDVELDSSHLSGIAGFTFFVDNQFHWISVGTDPNGVREVTLVAATAPGYYWLSPDPSPSLWVPGAFVSLVV